MPRRSRRRLSRPTAHAAAVIAIVLHAALLLVMASDPKPLPPRLTLFELLWAAARRPSFHLLIAAATIAPVLTYLAWTVAGQHRRALALSWAVFAVLMAYPFGERVLVMLRVIRVVSDL